jgi:zinc finger protein 830
MADVRALLKAKRQEVRITHPYAAYGANGALRCTACGAAIKFSSAWEGHLGSKAHRVALANLRAKEEEEEKARRATTTGAVSKRKAEEGEDEDEDGEGEEEQVETAMATRKKRQRTEEREITPVIDGSGAGGTGASHLAFPVDFFSDSARAPPRTSTGGQDDDDDDDDVEMNHDQDAAAPPPPPPLPPSKSQFDTEWDAFERDMQSLSHQERSSSRPAGEIESAEADPQETYARATIAAEPELVVSSFEGLPVDGATATAQEGTGVGGTGTGIEEGGRKVPEEELERRRKERDERELIMDRLMEEEREQEDAYGRVALLKNRIQMLKQKRELAKAKGKKDVAADMET